MKKLLIASTALTGMIASSAAIADVTVSAGATHGLIFVDSDKNSTDGKKLQDVKLVADYSLKFGAKTELDNGLTVSFGVGVDVDGPDNPDKGTLATNTNNDTVTFESAAVTIGGSFGSVKVGDIDSDNAIMTPTPEGHAGRLDGDMGFSMYELGDNGMVGGTGIAYFTPSIAGFKAGISYGMTSGQDSVGAQVENDVPEAAAGSVSYSGEFGAVSFKLGAGYATVLDNEENEEISFGGDVSFGDFGVNAIYIDVKKASVDSSTFGVGASYGTGPWGVSVGYQIDETDGSSDDETSLNGQVSYKIGSGVTAVIQADSVDDGNDSGFAVGTLLKTKF